MIISSLINIKNNCIEDKLLCDNMRSNILSNEYINNIKTELNDSEKSIQLMMSYMLFYDIYRKKIIPEITNTDLDYKNIDSRIIEQEHIYPIINYFNKKMLHLIIMSISNFLRMYLLLKTLIFTKNLVSLITIV